MTNMEDLLSKMKNITVQKKSIQLYKPPKSRGNVYSVLIKLLRCFFLPLLSYISY